MQPHALLASACVLLAAAASHAQVEFYDFPIEGSQEVPSVSTPAYGFASLEYHPDTMRFDLELIVDAIALGDITGAHLHMAPRGLNGPVIINLLASSMFVDDVDGLIRLFVANVPIGDAQPALRSAQLYLNVHTTAFPNGQLRGQVVPAPAGALALVGASLVPLMRRRRR